MQEMTSVERVHNAVSRKPVDRDTYAFFVERGRELGRLSWDAHEGGRP